MTADLLRNAATWILLSLPLACFSEASSTSSDPACPDGEIGCPCADGECDKGLSCAPSIDRCVFESCAPGVAGCTCLDGECVGDVVCDDGFCRPDSSSSGGETATVGSASGTGSSSTSSGTGEVSSSTIDPTVADGPSESATAATESGSSASATMSTTSEASNPTDATDPTGSELCSDMPSCDACLACAEVQCEPDCAHPSCGGFQACFFEAEGDALQRAEQCCADCPTCSVEDWLLCVNFECSSLCNIASGC